MSEYGFRTLHVMSTSDRNGMEQVMAKCDELGLAHSGLHTCAPNGGTYLTVFPLDSKVGWEQETEHKKDLYKVLSVIQRKHYEQGYVSMHFTMLYSYNHEQLNNWQNIIEISI
ncbi:hypothetical protein D3C73_209150 [compost metagenome]